MRVIVNQVLIMSMVYRYIAGRVSPKGNDQGSTFPNESTWRLHRHPIKGPYIPPCGQTYYQEAWRPMLGTNDSDVLTWEQVTEIVADDEDDALSGLLPCDLI